MARRDFLIVLFTLTFFVLLAAHDGSDEDYMVQSARLLFEQLRWKSLATPLSIALFAALSDYANILGEDSWWKSFFKSCQFAYFLLCFKTAEHIITLLLFLRIPGLYTLEYGFEKMVSAYCDAALRNVRYDKSPWGARAINMLTRVLSVLASPVGSLVLMTPPGAWSAYHYLTRRWRKKAEMEAA